MKKFYVGLKGIVIDPERGILILKKSSNEGGYWDVPGGRIDGSETFEQTLEREFSEELPGAKIKSIQKMLGAHRLGRDIKDDIDLMLVYFLVSVDLPNSIALSGEHDEYRFIKSEKEIPKEMNSDMTNIIVSLLKELS